MFLDEWYKRGGPDYHEVVVAEKRAHYAKKHRELYERRKVLCPECQVNLKGAIAVRCRSCHLRYMHKVRKYPARG